MKTKLTITKEELVIFASGEYLVENLPTNYADWSEEEFYEFLSDNAFVGVEDEEASVISDKIDCLASSLGGLFISKGFELV